MGDLDESQESCGNGKEKKRKAARGRVFTFIVYADSAYQDWIERLDGLHVRAFISPVHDADVAVDGTLKKAHWHVILLFDGKKSREQIDAIREEAIGPDFNRELQDVNCVSAMARYLIHMDNPEKAQYRREDVTCLGGADYELVSALPGDDSVVMGAISAYVKKARVTDINTLIAACVADGRRDWSSYISRRGWLVGRMIDDHVKRLLRVHYGRAVPGDTDGFDPVDVEELEELELEGFGVGVDVGEIQEL